MKSVVMVVVFTLGFIGCATTGNAAGAPTLAQAARIGVEALAAQVGVNPGYVGLAYKVASELTQGGMATLEQKKQAAIQGVNKAAAQALLDGRPFTEAQKSVLVEGLKSLL